jgi:hypothetical protein
MMKAEGKGKGRNEIVATYMELGPHGGGAEEGIDLDISESPNIWPLHGVKLLLKSQLLLIP